MIILSKKHGQHTVLYDDADHDLVKKYTWSLYKWVKGGNTLYATTNLKKQGKVIAMQHLIMGAKWIDHINRDGLDNRRQNLRKVTQQQNLLNKGVRRDCQSGFKGVGVRVAPKTKRIFYQVSCKFNGRRVHGGYFDNPVDAAKKYDELAKEMHGEFACLNFQ